MVSSAKGRVLEDELRDAAFAILSLLFHYRRVLVSIVRSSEIVYV